MQRKITEDQEVGVQVNRHWDRHGGQLKDQLIASGRVEETEVTHTNRTT